jgi:hypothetical protein
MAPVVALRERPVGRPVADHELIVAVDEESVAVRVRVEIAFPLVELWAPGLVTVTVLVLLAVTAQVKLAEPE